MEIPLSSKIREEVEISIGRSGDGFYTAIETVQASSDYSS